MNERSTAIPTRLLAHIDVVLCMESMCYAAIPIEQVETHARWHDEHRARSVGER